MCMWGSGTQRKTDTKRDYQKRKRKYETGIWPIEQLFEYRRITTLKNIIDSDDKRLIQEIIDDQIRNTFKGC